MKRTKYSNEFGAAVTLSLAARQMNQADLAKNLGQSTGFINHVITGRKKPPLGWFDIVADNLKLSDDEIEKMKQAAQKTWASDFKL